MTHRIVVRPAAEQDITDATDWYATQAPEQVERFLGSCWMTTRTSCGYSP